MRSVYDAVKSLASLVPATRTANTNGAVVDTKGFNTAKAVISAGDIDLANADETYAFKIQHGDASNGSDMADLAGATATVTADNDVKNIRIDGLGTVVKRYVRVVLTVGGTTPSIPCSAVIELGNAFSQPVQ
jgi:hypothetical protein